ncbi:hypothetical protein P691DRAFT_768299 [Macrolepiota fuliginosa MF-IS2]|uniref:Uncharacterized protein n=1 Tax=Macrolepiota fuliginosa MF-IS2 TaxID=1400762 RepID=A0A9P5WY49_9AGAR|nr:hypothetical protein P691DRAFT_768299 [Macrolepiota fuliginosa MF-IS2]
MSLTKEDTVDLFFPKPEEIAQMCLPEPPKSWHIIKLFHSLLAIMFHAIVVLLSLEMVFLSPMFNCFTSSICLPVFPTTAEFLENPPGALAKCLAILKTQLDTIDMLSMEIAGLEFHIESLKLLSPLVLDTKFHLDFLDASTPRNFARRVDGAHTIKALTTSEQPQGKVLGYFRSRSNSKIVPPSLVLDETLSSYCWEFYGN